MQNTMSIVPGEPADAGSDTCLPVGARLSDFEITGVIGEGGFGIVYLAFDHSLQRTVAIKEYMPGALARRGEDKRVTVRLQREQETFMAGLKSFINEARLLAQFDHPALIKVYRFWEENDTAYMAMRYYEGQTVKGLIKNSPGIVTEAWLRGMLKPVLEALDALYRLQILHRDISPDNIMIQNSGEAVLLDFGAARQIIGDMNHAVTVILKPGYAPIEQYANDAGMPQGPWTDIYSLSAVIYFAIAKKPPPTSVVRMIKDPIERLQDGHYPGFSKELLAAIDMGLAVKSEDRPQSIEAFRQMLQLELSVPVPTPGAATMPPSKLSSPSAPSAGGSVSRYDAEGNPLVQPSPKRASRMLLALPVTAIICGIGIAAYASFNSEKPALGTASAVPAKPGSALEATRAHDEMTALDEHNSSADNGAQRASNGMVQVNIKPWGAIVVDGVLKGVSPPLKKLQLAEGKHQIKIENPNFRSQTIEINITNKNTGVIEHDFSANKK